MKYILLAASIILFVMCEKPNQNTTRSEIPDFSKEILYNYCKTTFVGLDESTDLMSYEYYDENDRLLEKVGREYRVKYRYDSINRLKETLNCRIYNCKSVLKTTMLYDSMNNPIGSYITSQEGTETDSIDLHQTMFYNDRGQIERELRKKGTDVYGEKFEYWLHYEYHQGKIIREVETKYHDTTWIGSYYYDDRNNLISIKRIYKDKYENETFTYDESNRMIKKSIESNKHRMTEKTLFSVSNSSTLFKYDEKGRLHEELTLNHHNEPYRKFTFKYQVKKEKN